jgi:hypothetical protein
VCVFNDDKECRMACPKPGLACKFGAVDHDSVVCVDRAPETPRAAKCAKKCPSGTECKYDYLSLGYLCVIPSPAQCLIACPEAGSICQAAVDHDGPVCVLPSKPSQCSKRCPSGTECKYDYLSLGYVCITPSQVQCLIACPEPGSICQAAVDHDGPVCVIPSKPSPKTTSRRDSPREGEPS